MSGREIQDWRRGPSVCQVHSREMKVVVVSGLAGPAPQFMPEYVMEKEKSFPNSGIDYGPELQGAERGTIYVCSACEEAKAAWRPKPGK